VEVPIGIRQEMHLEPLNGLFDIRAAREQRGHDNHGSEIRRYPVRQFELGKQPGGNDSSDQAMDEGHCDI
jgi:hypothetical protein